MGSFGNYLENKVLNHVFGKSSYTAPTIFLALSTGDPLDDASGVAEPSGNGYARKETAGSDWSTSSAGSTTNATDIEFPESTGDWGICTHFALYDAATVGNMLAHGQLTNTRNISSAGIVARFKASTLVTTLT